MHADKDKDNSPHHSDEFPATRKLEAGEEEGKGRNPGTRNNRSRGLQALEEDDLRGEFEVGDGLLELVQEGEGALHGCDRFLHSLLGRGGGALLLLQLRRLRSIHGCCVSLRLRQFPRATYCYRDWSFRCTEEEEKGGKIVSLPSEDTH